MGHDCEAHFMSRTYRSLPDMFRFSCAFLLWVWLAFAFTGMVQARGLLPVHHQECPMWLADPVCSNRPAESERPLYQRRAIQLERLLRWSRANARFERVPFWVGGLFLGFVQGSAWPV